MESELQHIGDAALVIRPKLTVPEETVALGIVEIGFVDCAKCLGTELESIAYAQRTRTQNQSGESGHSLTNIETESGGVTEVCSDDAPIDDQEFGMHILKYNFYR